MDIVDITDSAVINSYTDTVVCLFASDYCRVSVRFLTTYGSRRPDNKSFARIGLCIAYPSQQHRS